MKKTFIFIFFFVSAVAQAQMKEGRIVYERVLQLQFRRPQGADIDPDMKLPTTRTDAFELLFGNNQSLWRSLPKSEGDNNTITNGSATMVIHYGGADDITYFDFSKSRRVDKKESFDNIFIIEDTISKLQWKLTDETKTILGHNARKAITQKIGSRMRVSFENGQMKRESVPDTSSIVAWFSTDFPVTVGPQEYQGQLPGAILQLDVNNGRIVYNAVEISPKVNVSNIKEPKGGKKVTPEEFTKATEKMMEEMRKNMPAGRNISIQSN
jgi:GLPGLI family protein